MQSRARANLVVATLTLLASCAEAPLDSEEQKASYGIGLQMGRQLAPARGRLNLEAFQRGVADALAGVEPALSAEEMERAVTAFSASVMEAANALRDSLAAKNSVAGQAFLATNGAKAGVVTTDSGVQYEVLRAGSGRAPTGSDSVVVHVRGTLIDGTEFESSYDNGEPAQYAMSQLIPGFAEALELMSEGAHYRIVVPGALGYGMGGMGRYVEPMATLIFEVELLRVVSPR